MTPKPWILQELVASGPWGTAVANPTSLRGGFAPQYNTLSLVLYLCPVSHLYLKGQAVTLKVRADNLTRNTLFIGRVRAAKRLVGGPDENAVYCECDGEESMADYDYVNSVRAADAWGWIAQFNEGGRPNCHPTNAEFYRGQDAILWTGAAALRKIRDKYMARSTWTLTDAQITAVTALTRELRPFDARGQRPLAAMCQVLEQCGCRMAFRYNSGTCTPVLFDAAGSGTFEVTYKPETWSAPPPPSDPRYNEIYEIACGYDSRRVTPRLDAVSGRKLVETTYSTATADPLLTGAAARDPEFLWDYKINVANYAAHSLGANLAAGSRPWPLLPTLCTRRHETSTAYLTASEVTAAPDRGEDVDAKTTLAILIGADWKRVTGGVRVDLRSTLGVLVSLKRTVSYADTAGGNDRKYQVPTGAAPDVRITAATELPAVASASLTSLALAAATCADGLLNLETIQPAYRIDTILQDPTSANPNAWVTQAAGALETYRDVATVLSAAAAGPYAQRGKDASLVEIGLPFWPAEVPLGAILEVTPTPANSGITGNEIIREYTWDLGDVEVRFKASDALDLADEDQSANLKDVLARLSRVERTRAKI